VRELSALRASPNTFEADETRLLQRMTIQESVRQWLTLQLAFEPQLQQTAALFAPERQAALAQLQLSLHRLAEWQERYGKSLSIRSGASTAAE
jgi:elongation factor P--beta-lysine ligase